MRRHIKVKATLSGDGETVLLDVIANRAPTGIAFWHTIDINAMGPFRAEPRVKLTDEGLKRVLVEGTPPKSLIKIHTYRYTRREAEVMKDAFYLRGSTHWSLFVNLRNQQGRLNKGIPVPLHMWPHVKSAIKAYNKEYAE